jgi:hypothetical protein
MLTQIWNLLILVVLSMGCAVTKTAQIAEGTNAHFFHEVTTTGAPERVWALWTDLSTWPQWDPETEYARAEGPFVAGLEGTLKGKGAPESRFRVTRLEAGSAYEFSTELPLGGRLVILRELVSESGLTRFKHDVRFEGFGGWLFAPFFGPKYRTALPGVLERIRLSVEAQSP